MTYGTFEARLAEMLSTYESELPENVKLAYLPSSGVIKLRLTTTGSDYNILTDLINKQVRKLYEIIPGFIYGEDEESLEMVIGKLLKSNGKTVSTAESCTGGAIAHLLTSVPGSSLYFRGSVIAYDNSVKTQLLGVKESTIEKHGAVSEDTVKEMVLGARNLFNTDYAIATSGIAGPDGGTESKPVGIVWIAVASEGNIICEKHIFGKDRMTNIKRFSLTALNMLRKQIVNQ